MGIDLKWSSIQDAALWIRNDDGTYTEIFSLPTLKNDVEFVPLDPEINEDWEQMVLNGV